MFRRSIFALAVVVVAMLALAAPAFGGGWAVVTLDELPTEVRAGEQLHLGFMVRQHGQTPTNDVTPYLSATKEGATGDVRVTAKQEGVTGHFVVDVTFPSDGVWRWQIVPAPFEGTKFAPLTVLPAAAQAAKPAPAVVEQPAAQPAPAAPDTILGLSPAGLRWGGVALLIIAAGVALAAQRGMLGRRAARAQ
jgi:hypothetical protein